MTDSPSLLSNFQPHKSTTPITLANDSTSSVIRSKNLSIYLHFLSLPQLSLNLISFSKIIRALNFFHIPGYCLFHDLPTKKNIGDAYEFDSLYILDTQKPRSIACIGIVYPFEAHC